MKKIVTIGGGNGHSSILRGLFKHFKNNDLFGDFFVTSIVSMSDDGRTTGLLMREMQKNLDVHMPPPGDLRKCSLALSNSIYREKFKEVFESVIDCEGDIINFSLKDMLYSLNVGDDFISYIETYDGVILNTSLPLQSPISGHKFGNLLMASIYYNYGDYNRMINFFGGLLEVKGKVIPVTIDRANIFAELGDLDLVDTQDKISNEASYKAPVKELYLSRDSKDAKINEGIEEVLEEADFIIVGPGDLFTSIDANFLIEGFTDLVKNSKAKKIYIMNSNNKRGETTDYNEIDFIDFIEQKIGLKLDLVVANKKETQLTSEEKIKFKNDISVKGGRYLFVDDKKEKEINEKYPHIEFLLGEYVDKDSLYKNNDKMIEDIVGYIHK